MANPWLEHVSQYRAQNPNMSYKDCLINAKATYVKQPKAQKGGILPVLATVGSLALTADQLSKPISQATISNGKLVKGSKREFDTKLIAEKGIIASIPEMVAEDNKRRARAARSRK